MTLSDGYVTDNALHAKAMLFSSNLTARDILQYTAYIVLKG
jgi:hypothetical protein